MVEAAFGGDEPLEVQNIYEEATEEEEEEESILFEESATPSTSKVGKQKQSSLSAPKGAKSSKLGFCSLENAEVYYPTTANEGSVLHAGVDPKYLSSRKLSHHTAAAGYRCLYSDVCKSEGKIVPNCDIISTTKGQLSTHIRQHYLGLAVACYICQKKWWSAATWMDYMRKAHKEVGADIFFVKEGMDKDIVQVKQEVEAGDI